jgi:hypothetical protein
MLQILGFLYSSLELTCRRHCLEVTLIRRVTTSCFNGASQQIRIVQKTFLFTLFAQCLQVQTPYTVPRTKKYRI